MDISCGLSMCSLIDFSQERGWVKLSVVLMVLADFPLSFFRTHCRANCFFSVTFKSLKAN